MCVELFLQVPYCQEVVKQLLEQNIRAEMASGERLGKLVRNAEVQKVPLMAVVGPKEVESQTLTVRTRHGGEIGTLSVDEVAARIKAVVASRGFL